jgi:hypothetical protein
MLIGDFRGFLQPFYANFRTILRSGLVHFLLNLSFHCHLTVRRNRTKSKLSLGLIKHNAMKINGGSGGISPPFLTSALDGGEWSASRPCRFTPGETTQYPLGGPRNTVLPSPGMKRRLKNGVFRDVTPCGSCKNRRFGGI